MEEIYFDDEGDLLGEISQKLFHKKQTLTGNEALAFMAEECASQTHGNYCGETIYMRMFKEYDITIKLKEQK